MGFKQLHVLLTIIKSDKNPYLTKNDAITNENTVANLHQSLYPNFMIQIALYQPDIPGNTGTIMRMAACLGVPLHIIEPAGFDLSERNLKRAGMDYLEMTNLTRHLSWKGFYAWHIEQKTRLVLASTKASKPYCDLNYDQNDILLFGRESSGVPEDVHDMVDDRILIKMQPEMRSLNLALSVAMITGEALRQTGA